MSREKPCVMFVCQANYIRSPAAEIIANTIAKKEDLSLSFASAGLEQIDFLSTSGTMARTLRDMSYPAPEKSPQLLTAKLLSGIDSVLCFTSWQKEKLEEKVKIWGLNCPINTLPGFCGSKEEIIDPNDLLSRNRQNGQPRIIKTFTNCLSYGRGRLAGKVLLGKIPGVYLDTENQIYQYTALEIEKWVKLAIRKMTTA